MDAPVICYETISYDNAACGDPECCGSLVEWSFDCELPNGHTGPHSAVVRATDNSTVNDRDFIITWQRKP